MLTKETKIRVRYSETDQMQVVYHSRFLEYFETGRTDSLRSLGMTYKSIEEQGVVMAIVQAECKYVKPARYDDLLTIKTSIHELPKNHRIEFHQDAYNESGQLLVRGKVVLYFLDKVTFTKTTIPDALHTTLQPFFEKKENA